MPSRSTRRRFLTGTAGVLAALAGCNEQSGPSNRGTVTPVDVPRTDEELLREAAAIDSPTVPPAVIVSETHFEAAIDHVKSVRRKAEAALDDSGIDPEDRDAAPYDTPASILDNTDDQLEHIRSEGKTRRALRIALSALREVGRLLGVLQAKNGTIDRESIRRELQAEREAVAALGEGFEYRLAAPIEKHLPTLAAAEEKLREAEEDQAFAASIEKDDGEVRPLEFGEARLRIERIRRLRDDAERFRSTATDASAPSIRGRIDDVLTELEAAVRPIAEEYGADPPEQDDDMGATVEGRIRNVRRSVGSRSRRWTEEFDEYRRDGHRVRGLLEVTEWLLLFEAVDVAVDRTLERLGPDEFPTESVVTEKRRAVEAVEPIAEGTALQRRFAERAHGLLRSADSRAERGIGNSEEVAFVHLLYASAKECAGRAASRAETMAETLGE